MRLWLRDSERRPDPAPVVTDDRKPILVGLVAWVVGLVVLLLVPGGEPLWRWASGVGILLGVAGLLYTHRRHSR